MFLFLGEARLTRLFAMLIYSQSIRVLPESHVDNIHVWFLSSCNGKRLSSVEYVRIYKLLIWWHIPVFLRKKG